MRRAVLCRAMHRPNMVERTGPCRCDQGLGAAKVEPVALRLHGAAEEAVGTVMVEGGAAVTARQHHQRPILFGGIVEQHADSQQVVVGVRVEGPVLVPFHRGADLRRFQVELRAVQPHATGAEQCAQHRQQPRCAHELGKHRVHQVRFLDATHARLLCAVRGLEVEHVVMRAYHTRGFDQVSQHLLHALARQVVEQAFDDDETVAAVLSQALCIDVGHASYLSRRSCARQMVALTFMLAVARLAVKHG